MKKLTITRKPMITIRSKRGGWIDGCDAAETGRRVRLAFQPIREVLLQICCRCSHRQQFAQFMVVVLENRQRRISMDRDARETALSPETPPRLPGSIANCSPAATCPGLSRIYWRPGPTTFGLTPPPTCR
jgi:hypothetical protein